MAPQEQVLELKLSYEFKSNPLFSPDSTMVLTCKGGENKPCLWSSTTGKLLHTLEAGESPVCYSGFNHDGTMIITGSYDGLVRFGDFHAKVMNGLKGKN